MSSLQNNSPAKLNGGVIDRNETEPACDRAAIATSQLCDATGNQMFPESEMDKTVTQEWRAPSRKRDGSIFLATH